jgi:hypothetical protein
MKVYLCLGEPITWVHYGEDPSSIGERDAAIVAANSRSQARYLFWRKYNKGEDLTEFRCSVQHTGEIDRDEPGELDPHAAEHQEFWATPAERKQAEEEARRIR